MNYIFMDLDGTLTDPKEGITKCFQYALKSFGIEVKDRESLCRHIGPPLLDSFLEYEGFDEAKAQLAIQKYRERFQEIGWRENKVYEGIEAVLEQLKENNRKLVVATSKPELFAERILKYFKLDHYFEAICGASTDSVRSKKADVIAYAIKRCEIMDKKNIIMVGDRKYDIIGAKQNGLTSLGVLYGYGDLTELKEAGADGIAETVPQIAEWCLNRK